MRESGENARVMNGGDRGLSRFFILGHALVAPSCSFPSTIRDLRQVSSKSELMHPVGSERLSNLTRSRF
jgi:hypothetical protein